MKSELIFAILVATSAMPAFAQAITSETTPFSIEISVQKKTIKSGEPVQLNVRITNTSDHDINVPEVRSNGLDLAYDYEVQGPKGAVKHVDNNRTGKVIQHIRDRSVQPGGSTRDREVVLSNLYDMTAPGEYVIALTRAVSNNPSAGTVKSNSVKITVMP